MDTVFLGSKKYVRIAANTMNFAVIVALLLAQNVFEGAPLLAQDQFTRIANNAIVSPLVAPIVNTANTENQIRQQISIQEQTKIFNENVRKKYKNGYISDVAQGVKRIQITKTYQGRPVKINVIEVNTNLNPNLKLTPATAASTLNHKSTITTIAKNNNSIVAINGTFFKPSSGVPLGTLMINKKIYTGPMYDRVSMGIFDNGYDMARIQLNATLKTWNNSIKVDNINQPRMLSTHVIVYTPQWGKMAPVSPKYGTQIAVSGSKIIAKSTAQLQIPQDGYVVVGPAQQLNKIANQKDVNLDVLTAPKWENVNHIISGGPYLVKNGQSFVDINEQKLNSIGGRNPRTAVGYTADNHLIIVAVDGREKSSIGMTLKELSYFMKSIGCYNAMNLDGGGSTVLYVNGRVVNNPHVKGGIALSNALTINKI